MSVHRLLLPSLGAAAALALAGSPALGFSGAYSGTLTACTSPANCQTSEVAVTVQNGSVTSNVGLSGTISSDGTFDGTFVSRDGSIRSQVSGTFTESGADLSYSNDMGFSLRWDLTPSGGTGPADASDLVGPFIAAAAAGALIAAGRATIRRRKRAAELPQPGTGAPAGGTPGGSGTGGDGGYVPGRFVPAQPHQPVARPRNAAYLAQQPAPPPAYGRSDLPPFIGGEPGGTPLVQDRAGLPLEGAPEPPPAPSRIRDTLTFTPAAGAPGAGAGAGAGDLPGRMAALQDQLRRGAISTETFEAEGRSLLRWAAQAGAGLAGGVAGFAAVSAAERAQPRSAAPRSDLYCPACGIQAGPQSRFCTSCGTQLRT